jgi:glycosyltransferase involved in cell wall biosynthesis
VDGPSPTFSVVVPAYNAARTIAATLESIRAQTQKDFEVVVVDDGSTDATAGIVARLGDDSIRLIHSGNAGPAAARNAGIAASCGRFVSFLDADDLWLPGYLEAMHAALEGDPEAAVAFTDAWAWNEATSRFSRGTVMLTATMTNGIPHDARSQFRLLLDRNVFFVSTTVRREVLDDVGGFNVALTRGEDWELWQRLAARGWHAVRAAPILAIYRVRAGSLSSDRSAMKVAEAAVLEKVLAYELDAELQTLVARRLADVRRRHHVPDEPRGRERFTQYLPSLLRLRTSRWRRPPGVPAELVRLLRESQGST